MVPFGWGSVGNPKVKSRTETGSKISYTGSSILSSIEIDIYQKINLTILKFRNKLGFAKRRWDVVSGAY